MDRPIVEYPCSWSYAVIGVGGDVMADSVRAVLEGESFEITESKRSRTGKYVSYEVSVEVESEGHRDRIYGHLKELRSVKIVF